MIVCYFFFITLFSLYILDTIHLRAIPLFLQKTPSLIYINSLSLSIQKEFITLLNLFFILKSHF